MPNRLAGAASPYLAQHADNPVDWWPWCDEAFEEARRRDVPVFLSVGYSACHWCHVMAHESFEDAATAALLNDRFVSIKVDREERPDVDAVYMEATVALTGHGGWPMSVFLDHDGRPFYAGTYFPPQPRQGMPSFTMLLTSIDRAWREQREELGAAARRITDALAENAALPVGQDGAELDVAALDAAVDVLTRQYDTSAGGFGGAPKFPPSMTLEHLLRAHARYAAVGDERTGQVLAMIEGTGEAMARGGMYDQLGGGFARYSVDADWVVPHFEKMLYDNALLLRVYLHWWRATGSPLAQRVVRETAEFLLREMRTAEGGFAAALDADSAPAPGAPPVEGAFYAWTPEQLVEVLGDDDGPWAAALLAVTRSGTFEHGSSVLQLRRDPDDEARWQRVRAALLAAREQRPRPARDDKVVAAWNGLAIAALAEAGALLDEPEWVEAAMAAGDLLVSVHLGAGPDDEHGDRLTRVSRDGVAGVHAPGVLEDHADVAEGFLALYQVTGDDAWLAFAGVLLDVVLAHFGDEDGGFHDTADDAEALVRRPQDPTDNAVPSGWSAAAGALLGFAALTGSGEHRDAAGRALGRLRRQAVASPRFLGWALAAGEAWVAGPAEIAVVGPLDDPRTAALRRTALAATAPGAVVAVGDPAEAPPVPLLHDRPLVAGAPAAYVCRGFVCERPVTDPAALAALVGARAS